MNIRSAKELSDEDRILWNLVARTARPLDGRKLVEEPPSVKVPVDPAGETAAAARAAPALSSPRLHVSRSLDAPILEKLARGKLPIEGRVDLHGLTQDEAHRLLLSFLQRAHAGGVRYVLVITGKGYGGEGVLRRLVPVWLSTPPFRTLVSSHDHAARFHGGAGALYVRLRRQRPQDR